jgi:hypothetical protein
MPPELLASMRGEAKPTASDPPAEAERTTVEVEAKAESPATDESTAKDDPEPETASPSTPEAAPLAPRQSTSMGKLVVAAHLRAVVAAALMWLATRHH